MTGKKDELDEALRGLESEPPPAGKSSPHVVELPWGSSVPPASRAPRTWPAEAPTRVRHEVQRAASRMRSRELPGWLVALGKWASVPMLAILVAVAGYIQAKTSLLREEAARVAADTKAKESESAALRSRLTGLEGAVGTLQSQLADARQRVTDLERERSEAPLEVNPRKRPRSR